MTVADEYGVESLSANDPQDGQLGRARHHQLMECGRVNTGHGCMHVFLCKLKEEGVLEV